MMREPDLEDMYASEWDQYRQLIGGGPWPQLDEESRAWFRGHVPADEVRRCWQERREAQLRVARAMDKDNWGL